MVVVDGDIIVVGFGIKVCYIGVDVLEVYKDDCWVDEVFLELNEFVFEGIFVCLLLDVNLLDKDFYGCLLWYVFF